MSIKLFISYAHRDEDLRKELDDHLSNLKRQQVIAGWHDREIVAGQEWAGQIDEALNSAQIVLLLISAKFMASDYCHDQEMLRAMERHNAGEAVVIPIILSACDWDGAPFSKLQGLPKDFKPIESWPNRNEAWTDVVKGLRKAIQRFKETSASPPEFSPRNDKASSSKPPPNLPKASGLDFEQYAAALEREKVGELKVANAYLLGGKDKFVGREKELSDLTYWLDDASLKMLCLCDLGGTGKSALVWHWLNHQDTQDLLKQQSVRKYWCSFYARNFDALAFLRELAALFGGPPIVESDQFIAQTKLKQFVLSRLKTEKWLLVLDGLEREMGAFANPEYFQVDSEEQDCRNEQKKIEREDRSIRGHVFPDFLRELLKTETKVLITSRLFPENLKFGAQPLPGVINYPFEPMSVADAARVWNLAGHQDRSPLQSKFFASVESHPQVISVMAAALKEQAFGLSDWFACFTEAEQQACLDEKALLTTRRHRWLELAMRDLTQQRRAAWLTLCYIVRRSEASSIDALMDSLVDTAADQPRPGRFLSADKLIEELNYLVKRRLIGADFTRGQVDVHPVIRGQVMRHIMKQYEAGHQPDEELIRHVESTDDFRELMLRFLNQPNPEERYRSLDRVLDGFKAMPAEQQTILNILGRFYVEDEPTARPWLNALPALRLRKEQAWVLLRTGNELMTRGSWDESSVVFRRAQLAYQLCGDWQALEDCQRSHNWQSLYGGALFNSEQQQLAQLEKGERAEYTPYWLALLLAIRQSEHAADLLEALPAETSRWTLQTIAEAWFYLEEYERAAELALAALKRRDQEEEPIGQLLWETVTLGLALVRLGKCDEAIPYLDFAKARGTGWAYNLVPMFALAGLIEWHYRVALRSNVLDKQDELVKAEILYKDYGKADPNDSFQIPAAEAHLAMARVHWARGEADDALALAQRALRIARREAAPFHYGSAVRRVTQFLTEELRQPVPPAEEPDMAALDHEERLLAWLNPWKERRK